MPPVKNWKIVRRQTRGTLAEPSDISSWVGPTIDEHLQVAPGDIGPTTPMEAQMASGQ